VTIIWPGETRTHDKNHATCPTRRHLDDDVSVAIAESGSFCIQGKSTNTTHDDDTAIDPSPGEDRRSRPICGHDEDDNNKDEIEG
jgi:hypothetical protein